MAAAAIAWVLGAMAAAAGGGAEEAGPEERFAGVERLALPVITLVVQTSDSHLDFEGLAEPFDVVALDYGDTMSFVVTQAGPDGIWAMRLEHRAGFPLGTVTPMAFSVRGKREDSAALKAVGPSVAIEERAEAIRNAVVIHEYAESPPASRAEPGSAGAAHVYAQDEDGRIHATVAQEKGVWVFRLGGIGLAAGLQRLEEIKWIPLIFGTNRNAVSVLRPGHPAVESQTFGSTESELSIGGAMIADESYWDVGGVVALKGGEESQLAELIPTTHRGVMVFVHGCCTSFDGALQGTARLWKNLQVASMPAVFSWPTSAGIRSYYGDRDVAVSSRKALLAFLVQVAAISQVDHVDVVAHSLGNQLLLEALRDLSVRSDARTAQLRSKLRHIVFASPDVDRKAFESEVRELSAVGQSRTLYVSAIDVPLLFSSLFSGHQRAGYISVDGPLVVPGVDTVDVSNANSRVFTWRHSAFSDDLAVLNDLSIILNHGTRPPNARLPILREERTAAGIYWRYPSTD